jgi:hypothetical protein
MHIICNKVHARTPRALLSGVLGRISFVRTPTSAAIHNNSSLAEWNSSFIKHIMPVCVCVCAQPAGSVANYLANEPVGFRYFLAALFCWRELARYVLGVCSLCLLFFHPLMSVIMLVKYYSFYCLFTAVRFQPYWLRFA